MVDYWLLGASKKVSAESCVKMGTWTAERKINARAYEAAKQIRVGDNIAIKKGHGPGKSDISILHLGKVKSLIITDDIVICVVDWIVTDLNREVEGKGAYKTIHGPYGNCPWINEIFCL